MKMEQEALNYKQYLALQNRVDWLYGFHPEYFDELDPQFRTALHTGLLYDVDDKDYPESIEEYYKTSVETDLKLQQDMLRAAKMLYSLSGSGELDLEEA